MDITMCMGGNCPLKETCVRYLAKPSEYQSFFMELPFQKIDDKVTCTFYYEKDLDSDTKPLEK